VGGVAGAGRSSTPVTWQPHPVRFGVQDARGGDGQGNSPGMCATGTYRVGQCSGVGAVGLGAYLGSRSGVSRRRPCSGLLIPLTLLVMAIQSRSGGR